MNKICIYLVNYNYGIYLSDSVNSILFQSSAFDEIIFCDNGSIDGSDKLLEELANKHKVDFFKLNRMKLGEIGNFISKKTKCDFMVRLDADDTLEKNFSENYKKIIKKTDPDIIFCNYNIIDTSGKFVETYDCFSRKKIDHSFHDEPFHGATTAIKVSEFTSRGGYLESNRRQDGFDLYTTMIDSKIEHIEDYLFNYRRGHMSLSKDHDAIIEERVNILRSKYSIPKFSLAFMWPKGVKMDQIYLEKINMLQHSLGANEHIILNNQEKYCKDTLKRFKKPEDFIVYLDLECSTTSNNFIEGALIFCNIINSKRCITGYKIFSGIYQPIEGGITDQRNLKNGDFNKLVISAGGIFIENLKSRSNSTALFEIPQTSLESL